MRNTSVKSGHNIEGEVNTKLAENHDVIESINIGEKVASKGKYLKRDHVTPLYYKI